MTTKLTYKGKKPYSLNTGFSFKQINKGDVIEVTNRFAEVLLANHPKDWAKGGKTKTKPVSTKPKKATRKKGGKNA